MNLLVDSTVWVDYFNGRQTPQTDELDRRLQRDVILVGDLILVEVLQGVSDDTHFDQAYNAFSALKLVQIVTPALAVQSARNYRLLRKKGVTVRKTIDSLIATWCIQNDVLLLHSDRDFDAYEAHLGLRVIYP